MFEPCYISSFLCGTLATTSISNQEYVRNYCKLAVKRHHQIFPRTCKADIIAAINLSKIKLLRFDGKIWNQISSGSFVWLVTKDEWNIFVNYLNSLPERPTRHGKKLVYHSPASLSSKELKDFVLSFCECNKFSLEKNAIMDFPPLSENRVASPAIIRNFTNDSIETPRDTIFIHSQSSNSLSSSRSDIEPIDLKAGLNQSNSFDLNQSNSTDGYDLGKEVSISSSSSIMINLQDILQNSHDIEEEKDDQFEFHDEVNNDSDNEDENEDEDNYINESFDDKEECNEDKNENIEDIKNEEKDNKVNVVQEEEIIEKDEKDEKVFHEIEKEIIIEISQIEEKKDEFNNIEISEQQQIEQIEQIEEKQPEKLEEIEKSEELDSFTDLTEINENNHKNESNLKIDNNNDNDNETNISKNNELNDVIDTTKNVEIIENNNQNENNNDTLIESEKEVNFQKLSTQENNIPKVPPLNNLTSTLNNLMFTGESVLNHAAKLSSNQTQVDLNTQPNRSQNSFPNRGKLLALKQVLSTMKKEQTELKQCLGQLNDVVKTIDIVKGLVGRTSIGSNNNNNNNNDSNNNNNSTNPISPLKNQENLEKQEIKEQNKKERLEDDIKEGNFEIEEINHKLKINEFENNSDHLISHNDQNIQLILIENQQNIYNQVQKKEISNDEDILEDNEDNEDNEGSSNENDEDNIQEQSDDENIDTEDDSFQEEEEQEEYEEKSYESYSEENHDGHNDNDDENENDENESKDIIDDDLQENKEDQEENNDNNNNNNNNNNNKHMEENSSEIQNNENNNSNYVENLNQIQKLDEEQKCNNNNSNDSSIIENCESESENNSQEKENESIKDEISNQFQINLEENFDKNISYNNQQQFNHENIQKVIEYENHSIHLDIPNDEHFQGDEDSINFLESSNNSHENNTNDNSLFVLSGDRNAPTIFHMRSLGDSPSHINLNNSSNNTNNEMNRMERSNSIESHSSLIGKTEDNFPDLSYLDQVNNSRKESRNNPVSWCRPSFKSGEDSVGTYDDIMSDTYFTSDNSVSHSIIPLSNNEHNLELIDQDNNDNEEDDDNDDNKEEDDDNYNDNYDDDEVNSHINDNLLMKNNSNNKRKKKNLPKRSESPYIRQYFFSSPIISYYEPFLRLTDSQEYKSFKSSLNFVPNEPRIEDLYNITCLLWALFQIYSRSDGPISTQLRMTQLLKMFRDAGLIRTVQSSETKERRKSISIDSQTRLSIPNQRRMSLTPNLNSPTANKKLNKYESAIENCPLLMSFDQFNQFIKSLGSSEHSENSHSLSQILESLYQTLQIEQESFLFSLKLQHSSSSTLPYPLQEESVVGQDSNILLSYSLTQPLESSGLRSSNFYATIWEKNMEQMKQLYSYYSQSTSLSKKSLPRGFTLVTFESYREFLQDFDLFPSIIDQKWLVSIYRVTKLWEWSIFRSSSSSVNLGGVSSNSTISTRHINNDLKRAEDTLELTFRGFLEALTRVALVIQLKHNQQLKILNDHTTSTIATPSTSTTVTSVTSQQISNDINTAIVVMLRLMDSSNGKKKLIASHRRSTCVRQFVYK